MGRYPERTNAPIAAVISIAVEIANSTMNMPTTDAGNPRPNMSRIANGAISASIFDSACQRRIALNVTRERRQRPNGRLFSERSRAMAQ